MIRQLKNKFLPLISNDIGVDLGTANTLVYLLGKGIVVTEPSVVAVNTKTGQVVAVGTAARDMLGRTPAHLVAVKPLIDGVVSDFEATEEMLAYLMNRAQHLQKKMLGPRVVIGVPSGVTNVEMRAVKDAAQNAGAREVHIVEEPIAAALGIRLPIREAGGSMLVDIGGGNTDIAVLSLGGIVRSKNLRVAGEKLNQDIIAYVRSEFKILIGEKTAEAVKIAIGSVSEGAGTLRKGLDTLLSEWLKVPVTVADDPLTAVARGTGVILENLELYRDMLIEHDDDIQ